MTGENGAFTFATIEPGTYSIIIEAEGFKQAQVDSLVLTPSETLPVGKARLEVGKFSQSVTVVAQGATVQTASSEHASLITGNQVQNLLVRGRNVTGRMQLVPGIVTPGTREVGLLRAPYCFNTVDYTSGSPVFIPKVFERLRPKHFSRSFDPNNEPIVVGDPNTGAAFAGWDYCCQ